MSLAPAALSSAPVAPVRTDDDMDLAELMELFEPEEPATPPSRRASHPSGTVLRAWRETGSRGANRWSVRLGGAHRAW